MTIEVATYINGLNSSYPESGSDFRDGDDHLRLLKSTIKATFPNVSGAVTVTHAELNYLAGLGESVASLRNRLSQSISVIGSNLAVISLSVSAAVADIARISQTVSVAIAKIAAISVSVSIISADISRLSLTFSTVAARVGTLSKSVSVLEALVTTAMSRLKAVALIGGSPTPPTLIWGVGITAVVNAAGVHRLTISPALSDANLFVASGHVKDVVRATNYVDVVDIITNSTPTPPYGVAIYQ